MKESISIEVEGNTVKEAVEKALHQLKVPRKQVKIEIVSEEKKGLFGKDSAQLAKVRVTIIEPTKK